MKNHHHNFEENPSKHGDKQTFNSLSEIEWRYKALFDRSFFCVFLLDFEGNVLDANEAALNLLEYAKEDIPLHNVASLVGEDQLSIAFQTIQEIKQKGVQGFPVEFRVRKKNGEYVLLEVEGALIYRGGTPYAIQGIARDVTALKARERELNIKTKNLEEVNAALNVLLKKRERDKVELEERVLLNVKQLIIPYIAKLKRSGLDERQNAIAAILESNLNEIISSFTHTLSSRHLNLTPKEVKIANLIKEGKTSKEICELLGSSPKAVAFHRGNIRRKLGIKNKKVNLKSYLAAKLNSKVPDLD